MALVYSSLCDGIGAAHVAWQPLGWRCAFVSEVDPFANAVVEKRWGLPNLGDMTKITKERIDGNGGIDIVCGGTPCQSFSLAGLRGGMDDPRGNLALVFLRIVDMLRPRFCIFENVPYGNFSIRNVMEGSSKWKVFDKNRVFRQFSNENFP